VVEDVLEEVPRGTSPVSRMEAPINKVGAEFFLNQNSREPVTEPDEMVPLVEDPAPGRCGLDVRDQGLGRGELLHVRCRRRRLEADCRVQGQRRGGPGCKVWLNTE
jgi:hypothetical protein